MRAKLQLELYLLRHRRRHWISSMLLGAEVDNLKEALVHMRADRDRLLQHVVQ